MWPHSHQCQHQVDADHIMITITFHRSRYSNEVSMTLCSCDATGTGFGATLCQCVINGTITFLRSRQSNWTWHFGHVMSFAPALHDVHGIISGTVIFLRSSWLKVGTSWLYVMWYHLCQHWQYMMPMVSSMTSLHFLGQDNQIKMQDDCFGYVMPLELA